MPASGEISIFPRNGEDKEIMVKYHVEEGVIHANPWPFSVDRYEGYLVAYSSEGYPEQLDPVILTYTLRKGTSAL